MLRIRGPNIRIPPAIYVGVFLIGLLVESVAPVPLARSDTAANALRLAGTVLLIAGAAVALWGVLTFWSHHTTMFPFKPAAALVQGGPYRFTRNPMYLGMTLAHAATALLLNVGWPLLLLPVAVWLVSRTVIRPEEEYLTRTFGEDYRAFTRRVRRWL